MELTPPVSDVVMLALDVHNYIVSESEAVERWVRSGVVLGGEQLRQISLTQLDMLRGGQYEGACVLAKLVLEAAARHGGRSRYSPWWQAADEFVEVTRRVLCRRPSGRRYAEAVAVVDLQLDILRNRLRGSLPSHVRGTENHEYAMTLLGAGHLVAEPFLLHSAAGQLGLARWLSDQVAATMTLLAEIARRRGDRAMPDVISALTLAEGYFQAGAEVSAGHLRGELLAWRAIVRERRLALAEPGRPRGDVVRQLVEEALPHLEWRQAPALFLHALRTHYDATDAAVDRDRHTFARLAANLDVGAADHDSADVVATIGRLAVPALAPERLAALWRRAAELIPADFLPAERAMLCEAVLHALPDNTFACPSRPLSTAEATPVADEVRADSTRGTRAAASTLVHLAVHVRDEDHQTAIGLLLESENIDDTISAEFFDCVDYARLNAQIRAARHQERNGEIADALISHGVGVLEAGDLSTRWQWPQLLTDMVARVIHCVATYCRSGEDRVAARAMVVVAVLLRRLTVTLDHDLAGPIEFLGVLMEQALSRMETRGYLLLDHHQLFKGADFGFAAAVGPPHELTPPVRRLLTRLAHLEEEHGPYVARSDWELEDALPDVPSGVTALAYANFYEVVPSGPDDEPTGTLRRSIDDCIARNLLWGARCRHGFPDQLGDWAPRGRLRETLPADTVLISLFLGERLPDQVVDEDHAAVLSCVALTRDETIAWRMTLNTLSGNMSILKTGGRIRALNPFVFQVAWVREAVSADAFGRPATPQARQMLRRFYSQLGGPPAQFLTRWWAEGRRHLCFWPHGPLHYVPFPLLELDGRPLADTWTITTTPSDVMLVRPVVPEADNVVRLAAVGAGHGGVELGMTPQPVVEDHVREVAGHFPTTDVLVGPRATPAEVMTAMTRSTYLHIAAHGSHDGEAAWFQCLYLHADEHKDGRLFAHDIVQLDLRHVRLVTLSACESAMGRYDRNDNLRGLPAAFLSAGAATVIGALWPISAPTATTFFATLYEQLAARASKRTAFRTAQTVTRAAFPAYRDWGAFTYIGDLR